MSNAIKQNEEKKYDDFFISSISIDGLFSKYNLHWELNNDVNILVGNNGSGKSTLFNLIKSSSNFNQSQSNEQINAEVRLLKDRFSIFKINFKNKFSLDTTYQEKLSSELLDEIKSDLLDKIEDDLSKKIERAFFEKNNLSKKLLDKIKSDIFDKVKSEVTNKLTKDLNSKLNSETKTLGLKIKIKPPLGYKNNPNQKNHIEDDININAISTFDTLILSKNEYDSRSDTVFSQLDFFLEKEAEKLKSLIILNQSKAAEEFSSLNSKKKRKEKAFKEINDSKFSRINEFEKQVNIFFSENGKLLKLNNGDIEIIQDDKKIPLEQLSSGEKQLLLILLNVINSTDKPAVLILDEPELSLHLSWQEKLITAITSIHPQVQLIITTHSPAIVMKGWMDKMVDINSLLTEIKQEKDSV